MALPKKYDFNDYDNFLTDPNPTTSAEAQDYFRNMDMLVAAMVDTFLWQPETNYANGDVVKSPSMPNGAEAVCVSINGGKSSNVEPQWGNVGGKNIADGTCFWELRWEHWSKENATNRFQNTTYNIGDVVCHKSNLKVALKCTQAGTTSNTEIDISANAVGDSVTDGSAVWLVVARDLSVEVADNAENIEANLQYLLEELKKYLPLSGGIMTGGIVSSGALARTIIKRNDKNGGISIYGADTYEDGAVIAIKGKNNSELVGEEGGFFISSTDGTTKYWLAGLKSGELVWRGSRIITANSIKTQYIETPNTPVYLPAGGTWLGIWIVSVSSNDYASNAIAYGAGGSYVTTTPSNLTVMSLICFKIA